MSGPVLVVGLGNALAADDGVGPAVVEHLVRRGLPQGLRAENGHTDSLAISALWRGKTRVWLVDALVSGASPGTIHVIEHTRLLTLSQPHGTAHHLSLPEGLRWIRVAQPEMQAVRYRLWGVEPASVRPFQGLSPEVARTVPELADRILQAASADS